MKIFIKRDDNMQVDGQDTIKILVYGHMYPDFVSRQYGNQRLIFCGLSNREYDAEHAMNHYESNILLVLDGADVRDVTMPRNMIECDIDNPRQSFWPGQTDFFNQWTVKAIMDTVAQAVSADNGQQSHKRPHAGAHLFGDPKRPCFSDTTEMDVDMYQPQDAAHTL